MSHRADSSWTEKIESQLLGKKFLHIYHIVGRIICIATLAIQLGILDYYLIDYNSLLWSLWLIADVFILLLFIFTVIISYRHLEMRSPRPHLSAKVCCLYIPRSRQYFGELPLTYVAWFVYSVILSV